MRSIVMLLLVLFLAGIVLADQGKEIVIFGVVPRYNPIVMYRSHQPVMDYLTEVTRYRFKLKIFNNYQEAIEMLTSGQVQVAALGDIHFTEICEGFDAKPILKPLNSQGESFYRSAIVVASNSDIQSLQDLHGRTFAFGDLHSTAGNLIPRYFLHRSGVDLLELAGFINLETHDAVARAVLKGSVDAGALKDVVAEQYRERGLKILALSEPIPATPVVVRKDTPEELTEAITQALLAIDPNNPQWVQKMKGWNSAFSQGYVVAREEEYEPIMALTRSIATGCGVRCH